MSEPLATVTAYWRREDAGVARTILGDAGIDAVVEETAVAKVRVDREEAVRAGDVLTRRCGDTLAEVDEADEEPRPNVCPACGSPDAQPTMRGRLFAAVFVLVVAVGIAVGRTDAAFLVLFAVAVALLTADRWRCGECGEGW